jgi:hypothetical protein|tara:strand:+ start:219 stop:428 length:210 start_codon:yes stop_codon:yes gene_type:complete
MFKEIVKTQNKSDMLTELLIFVLNVLIATFVLRFAWNRSLVPHVTVLKPLKSMLDAFILALSLNVVRGL